MFCIPLKHGAHQVAVKSSKRMALPLVGTLTTVTVQVAVLPPSRVVAFISVVPADTPITLPSSTVAISVFSDVHTIFLSVASVGSTVAVRANASPTVSVLDVSLRVIPVTAFTSFAGLHDEKAINAVATASNPKLNTFFINLKSFYFVISKITSAILPPPFITMTFDYRFGCKNSNIFFIPKKRTFFC